MADVAVELLKKSYKDTFRSAVSNVLREISASGRRKWSRAVSTVVIEFAKILHIDLPTVTYQIEESSSEAVDENGDSGAVKSCSDRQNGLSETESQYLNLAFYCSLLIFVVEKRYLSGKIRVLLKLVANILSIDCKDAIEVEWILTRWLVQQQEEQLVYKKEENNKKKYNRYLKIGAVSLGAGAVLAVTGGMVRMTVLPLCICTVICLSLCDGDLDNCCYFILFDFRLLQQLREHS